MITFTIKKTWSIKSPYVLADRSKTMTGKYRECTFLSSQAFWFPSIGKIWVAPLLSIPEPHEHHYRSFPGFLAELEATETFATLRASIGESASSNELTIQCQ